MTELIFFIIFILSLGGVLFILARKIPVLKALPYNGTTGIKKHHVILDVENRIKEIAVYFQKQILLHKILSWVKVMILRTETKVDVYLHKIRKNAQQIERDRKGK
jgi:hypothetical protein